MKKVPPPAYYAPVSKISPSQSKLRIVHNVAKGKEIDGYLDGKKLIGNFPYKRISDYLEVRSGVREVTIKLAGTTAEVISGSIELMPGRAYTLIANGHIGETSTVIDPLLLVDDLACPAPGKAHLRFIHATTGATTVDIYANQTKIFNNVSFGHVGTWANTLSFDHNTNSEYASLNAGPISVTVRASKNGTVLLGPIPFNLVNGGIYTVISSGILNDPASPLAALITEDSKGACVVTNV